MRIKRIATKILSILIPIGITCATYPSIKDYYFTSQLSYSRTGIVSTGNIQLFIGLLIVLDIIAWLFGLIVFFSGED